MQNQSLTSILKSLKNDSCLDTMRVGSRRSYQQAFEGEVGTDFPSKRFNRDSLSSGKEEQM